MPGALLLPTALHQNHFQRKVTSKFWRTDDSCENSKMCCQEERLSLKADHGSQSGVLHHCFWEKTELTEAAVIFELLMCVTYKESDYFQAVRNASEFSHLNILLACCNCENYRYTTKKPVPSGNNNNFHFGNWIQSTLLWKRKLEVS